MYETIERSMAFYDLYLQGNTDEFISKKYKITIPTAAKYRKDGEYYTNLLKLCNEKKGTFIYNFVDTKSEFQAVNKVISKELYYNNRSIICMEDLYETLKKPLLYRGVGEKTLRDLMKVINKGLGENTIVEAQFKRYREIVTVPLEDKNRIDWFEMTEKISRLKEKNPNWKFYYVDQRLFVEDSSANVQFIFSEEMELKKFLEKYS
jgi:hypothetical protein